MFDLALKIFFCGLLVAMVIHPWAGLVLLVGAVLVVCWRVWAFFALPFLWFGMKAAQYWANQEAARVAARNVADGSQPWPEMRSAGTSTPTNSGAACKLLDK